MGLEPTRDCCWLPINGVVFHIPSLFHKRCFSTLRIFLLPGQWSAFPPSIADRPRDNLSGEVSAVCRTWYHAFWRRCCPLIVADGFFVLFPGANPDIAVELAGTGRNFCFGSDSLLLTMIIPPCSQLLIPLWLLTKTRNIPIKKPAELSALQTFSVIRETHTPIISIRLRL